MGWRLGFLVLVLVLVLAACTEAPSDRLAAKWGCGPVKGLEAVTGTPSPAWILVGELTETAEAPAAIADIACHLATAEHKLFVGVTDYAGGATDAEEKMFASLNAMIAKGAPLVVQHLVDAERIPISNNKTEAEKARGVALTRQVAASGARRALLFVPHADAVTEPVAPISERFTGFTPMAAFLAGGVISLEIAPYPSGLKTGPEIRLYPTTQAGFTGLLTLTSLTRPSLAVVLPRRDPQIQELDEAAPAEVPPPVSFNFGNISPITAQEYQDLYDQLLHAIPDRAPD